MKMIGAKGAAAAKAASAGEDLRSDAMRLRGLEG
jgi:hypothetical protein